MRGGGNRCQTLVGNKVSTAAGSLGCGLLMRWLQCRELTESRAVMLVLMFSVQAVTHTGRLHRYLPSKASISRPWDAEDARRLS